MVTAIALWSHVLIPGEPEEFSPPCDLRITNVALGDELEDETGRTTLKLTYRHPSSRDDSDEEDEEKDEKEEEDDDDENEPITTVLCSLTPGKIEQAVIDIILEQDQDVLFETVGKNPIYLTGNFIDQEQGPPFHDHDEDSDEEGYRLEDVSSDVEIDPEEMDVPSDEDDSHRFEEVHETEEKKPAKDSKKRSRESDVMEVEEGKPSKAEKKKANKKLKADEAGKAVPTGTEEKPAEAEVGGEKKKEKKKKEKKAKDGETKKEGGEVKGDTKVLAGGLKIRDHKVGTGPQAKGGNTVGVRYVGKLDNGKVFDSNTKGKPFTFNLGEGEVIKGWDQGIAGMQVGGERLLVIPPTLAYGNAKQSGIPAGSTLTFEVKLVKISSK